MYESPAIFGGHSGIFFFAIFSFRLFCSILYVSGDSIYELTVREFLEVLSPTQSVQ